MLKILTCLVGVFILLVISESLTIKDRHKGELVRKFTHITVGTFIAFWPWLMSMRAIQIIGLAMVAVVYFNRSVDIFRFNRNLQRETWGDYFFALAISLTAQLTDSKILFAIAVLNLALADGLAAVIGRKYGAKWRYRIFTQRKSLIGSMTFWFISLCVFGVGALFAQSQINITGYLLLIVLAPPVLTLLENASVFGLDNITVPLAALGALYLASTF